MISLLLPTILLVAFGFFNLLGTNPSLAPIHLINFAVGLGLFFGIKKIGKDFFYLNSRVLYWFFMGCLVLTYFLGNNIRGSRRWIDLGIFNFQASEFFKVFFILFFAVYFAQNVKRLKEPAFFLATLGLFFLPTFLIFKQPDLGNAMVFIFIFIVLLFFSGIPYKYLAYIGGFVLASFPLLWFLLHDYQRDRILSFLNPHVDSAGTAYNMIQSIITTGTGGFFGRGLGLGTQTKLLFLPENQTDFAYAALVEQFGFVGGLVVIILYIAIFSILMRKIITFYFQKNTQGRVYFLYSIGLLAFLAFQVFVNTGMNMGIFPVTGIALPLISYGGSSLVTWMIGIALLP